MSDRFHGDVRFPFWALPYLGIATLDDVLGDQVQLEHDDAIVFSQEHEASYGKHSLLETLVENAIPFDANWEEYFEYEAGEQRGRWAPDGTYQVDEHYDSEDYLSASVLATLLDQPDALRQRILDAAASAQPMGPALATLTEAGWLDAKEQATAQRPTPVASANWCVQVDREARDTVSPTVSAISEGQAESRAEEQAAAMAFDSAPHRIRAKSAVRLDFQGSDR
jgi:hypothetical protein